MSWLLLIICIRYRHLETNSDLCEQFICAPFCVILEFRIRSARSCGKSIFDAIRSDIKTSRDSQCHGSLAILSESQGVCAPCSVRISHAPSLVSQNIPWKRLCFLAHQAFYLWTLRRAEFTYCRPRRTVGAWRSPYSAFSFSRPRKDAYGCAPVYGIANAKPRSSDKRSYPEILA
jgi:hypothetical protein